MSINIVLQRGPLFSISVRVVRLGSVWNMFSGTGTELAGQELQQNIDPLFPSLPASLTH